MQLFPLSSPSTSLSSHLNVSPHTHFPPHFHHPLDLLTMPSICLGPSDQDVNCDCVLFIPRKSKKSRCKNCGHSQSSHSDSTSNSIPQPHEHPTVAASQQDHNKYVDRLAKSLKASAVLEKARRETLQGFRPVPSASVCTQCVYAATH